MPYMLIRPVCHPCDQKNDNHDLFLSQSFWFCSQSFCDDATLRDRASTVVVDVLIGDSSVKPLYQVLMVLDGRPGLRVTDVVVISISVWICSPYSPYPLCVVHLSLRQSFRNKRIHQAYKLIILNLGCR